MMSNATKARPARVSRNEMLRRADAQQRGYEKRIANQIETINRLLQDPDSAAEIGRLHERIAELEAQQT